ncbi:unnamed protein product [Cuscuta campestris]|uniref:Retrotransposon gag domain-containing protein n=1 Tax=Cuscuta campestris TaxID=132261 RepID=A0A484LBX0_9ASTE|nr:unnamed protein product [Cuscuta campestris]
MSNTTQNMTHEELVASNAALQAQVDYLAKQIAQLTKQKLAMLQSSDDEEDASSSATIRTKAQDKSSSDFKVDIPIFEGKNDPDEFLEWLETVERVFDFKEVSDEKKVKLVALKFRKYASTWWSNIKTKRSRDEKPPVDTWQKMKTLLKKKFLPTEDMGCLVGFWAFLELQDMLGEGGMNVGRAEVEGQVVGASSMDLVNKGLTNATFRNAKPVAMEEISILDEKVSIGPNETLGISVFEVFILLVKLLQKLKTNKFGTKYR